MAEAAVKPDAIANVLDSFCTCYICLEQIKSSKCLPCTHMFCRDCLKQYIEKQQQDLPKGSSLTAFPCPVCRQDTLPEATEDNISDWADGYPSNDLVSSIVESKALQASKKTCKFCKVKKESDISAEFWCKNCNIFFCNNCKWMHDVISDDHVVIAVNEIKDNLFSALRYTTFCKQHGEIPRLFCDDHQEIGCKLCMTTCHRTCGKILITKDVAMGIKQNKEIEKLIDDLDVSIADVSGLVETVKDHFEIQENDKHASEDEIEMIMEEVKELFLEEVVKLYKHGKEKNTSKMKRCKQMEFALTHLRSRLSATLVIGDDADVVMMKTKGSSQIQKYCSDIHDEFQQKRIERLRVVPNIITRLKKIKIVETTDEIYNQKAPLTNRTSYPLKAKLQQSFQVSLPNDSETCNITGLLFYQKDRIIALDSANSSIKLIAETGEPLSHLSVPECEVWGLCQIAPQSFAVSCGSCKKILMVDVDTDQLVLKNTVTVDNPAYGIAYTGKSLIVTDGDSPSMIREYSTDGKELNKTMGNNTMKHILKLPKSGKVVAGRANDVSVEKADQTAEAVLMLYEDLKANKPLLSADYYCNVKISYAARRYKLSAHSFKRLHGLAVDELDNVLFVGIDEDDVAMVTMASLNGQTQDILQLTGASPNSISMYGSRFVLSERDSNTLRLYRMF